MEAQTDFVSPDNADQATIEKSRKCFDEYEGVRRKLLEVAQKSKDNAIRLTDAKGGLIVRATLGIEDKNVVNIDLIDAKGTDWEMNGDRYPYRISLDPKDKYYLTGHPKITVRMSPVAEGSGLDTVAQKDEITLSPHNRSNDRGQFIPDESDFSAALQFLAESLPL